MNRPLVASHGVQLQACPVLEVVEVSDHILTEEGFRQQSYLLTILIEADRESISHGQHENALAFSYLCPACIYGFLLSDCVEERNIAMHPFVQINDCLLFEGIH